jgi:hypothetical protein
MIDRIKKIVGDMGYSILKVQVDRGKVYFQLPDDLTRREVEDIAARLSMRGIPCKPFGTPWRRGFHVRAILIEWREKGDR